jgi:hypothetical protein
VKNYLTRKIFALTLILAFASVPVFAQLPLGVTGVPQALHLTDIAKLRPIGDLWARTDLYFGTAKPDGSAVTDAEFKRFLDQHITPRFPDGLTVLAGFGQFRTSNGAIVQERSMVLTILYPFPAGDSSRKIEEIRTIYKRTFQQESVLRVDSAALVSF